MSAHEGRRRSSTSCKVVSFIFSFFLSLFLALVVVLATVRVGIVSVEGFVALFDDEYFESLYTYTNDKFMYYTYPTGIDPSVVEDVITLEDVERDVTGITRATFEDVEYAPDLVDIKSRLTANVSSFLLGQNVEISGEAEEIVTTYVNEIVDIYLDAMKLPGLASIAKVRSRYLGLLTVSLAVCVGLAVILMIAIRTIHHFPHRSLRYIAYATGGASLMCLVVPAVLYILKPYLGLKLQPQYFYHFGVTAVNRTLLLIIAGGSLLAVVTVLLARIVSRMRRNLMHRRSRPHRESLE